MIAMKEVTVWNMKTQPNHTYLFDGTKAIAYIPNGKQKPLYFKKPIQIHRAQRKFVELKNNPFKKKVESNVIRVTGSKGDVYHVDPEAKTCTCLGFIYKHHCKHLEKVLKDIA